MWDSLQSVFNILVIALWPIPLPLKLKCEILATQNNDDSIRILTIL
jgi:hypothetical protein